MGRRPFFVAFCNMMLAIAASKGQKEIQVVALALLVTELIWWLWKKRARMLLWSAIWVAVGVAALSLTPSVSPYFGEGALRGRVVDAVRTKEGRQNLVMETQEIYVEGAVHPGEGKAAVYLPEDAFVRAGDLLVVRGSFLRPTFSENPGGFDALAYMRAEGLTYQFYAEKVIRYGVDETRWTDWLWSLRERVNGVFATVLPQEEAGVMAAMVTGSRGTLNESLRQTYTDGGIAHILAVSGLHTSLFALLFSAFCLQVLHLPKRVSLVVSGGALLAYLFFTGAGSSITRAVLMSLMAYAALLCGRENDPFTAMGLAGCVILLLSPYALFSAAFQLSFLSSGAYLWAGSRRENRDAAGQGVGVRMAAYVRVNVLATCLSAPLVLWQFHQFPVYGLLVNAVVLPFLGLLLGLGLGIGLLGLWWLEGAHFLAGGVYLILRFYQGVTEFFTSLPGAVVVTGQPPLWGILLFYGALLAVLVWQGKRRFLVWMACTASLGLGLVLTPIPKDRAVFLDVGQGDSTLLFTGSGQTILVDTGGNALASYGENTGEEVVLPALRYYGKDRIDALILTHLDADHALGAVELLRAGVVERLYLPPWGLAGEVYEDVVSAAAKTETKVRHLSAGMEMVIGPGETLRCLSPYRMPMLPEMDDNDTSIVLQWKTPSFTLLLMGDAGAAEEEMLLALADDLRTDVLKVGHHGAAGSTSAPFLAATAPKDAIISCGVNNIYGHPSPATVQRLEEAGVHRYQTSVAGAIELRGTSEGYQLIQGENAPWN